MLILRQFLIVLAVCLSGEFLNRLLNISIPGNVLGMILLLTLLLTGVIKLEMIDKVTKFLLDHLAFFFIPAGVGILNNVDAIRGQWIPIVTVIIISTILVIVTTGITIQLLKKKESV
ncbi:MAG: CidA/LrgA family protein [Clostridiaceae bacterium]|nr:CidA/LrgA family protein [Clostridiaceae bacterium]